MIPVVLFVDRHWLVRSHHAVGIPFIGLFDRHSKKGQTLTTGFLVLPLTRFRGR